MRALATMLLLLGLLAGGCATAPMATTSLASATTTSLAPTTTTTESTVVTFAVDYTKLEPAWKAYVATIAASDVNLGYEQFRQLLFSLATEVELLSQQKLTEKERVFTDDLRAAIENFKTGLGAWELERQTPAPALRTAMEEAWLAARASGNKAGAILRGE